MRDSSLSLLYALLRHALWGRPSERLAADRIAEEKEQCWSQLVAMAREQEIETLIFDALPDLPADVRPTQEILMPWAARVAQQERIYQVYLERLKQMTAFLCRHHVANIPFKGVTLSRYYPHPDHRRSGDIDLLIAPRQRPTVTRLLSELGARQGDGIQIMHDTYLLHGIYWDFHFKTMEFFCPWSNKRFRLLERTCISDTQICTVTIAGTDFPTLPPLFNIVYLTAHIQKHLLVEYISLRQICDWMLVLHHERTALGIAEQQLVDHLSRLGLLRLYRALGAIAQSRLGLSADSYAGLDHLTALDHRRGEFLLQCIIERHIPGCRPYTPRAKVETWQTKATHFIQLLKRCLALRHLTPRESFFAPWCLLRYALIRRVTTS